MKRNIFKKSGWDIIRSAILPIIFTLAIMGMVMYALSETEASSKAEAVKILENSIRRAVVMSYAIEGKYPQSVAYIEEHYGVHVDYDKYIVHYDIFGSNIMPYILVIEINSDTLEF